MNSGCWFPTLIIHSGAKKWLEEMKRLTQKELDKLIFQAQKEASEGIFGFGKKNITPDEALELLKKKPAEHGTLQSKYIWLLEKDDKEVAVQQIYDMADLALKYTKSEVFITREDLHLIYKWC